MSITLVKAQMNQTLPLPAEINVDIFSLSINPSVFGVSQTTRTLAQMAYTPILKNFENFYGDHRTSKIYQWALFQIQKKYPQHSSLTLLEKITSIYKFQKQMIKTLYLKDFYNLTLSNFLFNYKPLEKAINTRSLTSLIYQIPEWTQIFENQTQSLQEFSSFILSKISQQPQLVGLDRGLELTTPIIPEEVKSLTRYQNISITSTGSLSVAIEIFQLPHLKYLSFKEIKVLILPSTLPENENLIYFNASKNALFDIPGSIGKLRKLEDLLLNGNHLSSIPTSLSQLLHLKQLDLSDNQFENFPAELAHLPNLERLELSNNKISVIDVNLCGLKALQALSLKNNPLKEFPVNLLKLATLTSLNLSKTELGKMTGKIEKLQNLVAIDLSENYLKELPKQFQKLTKLVKVDIRWNSIKKIPDYLYKIKDAQLTQLL